MPTPPPTTMHDDRDMTIIEDDSQDVEYLTPSKVVRVPRVKRPAGRIKSPFVVSTETRHQLRNTFPLPNQFDPKRPVPPELTQKFLTYMQSDEDTPLDYDICEIRKDFFHVFLSNSELTDTVNNYYLNV